MKVNVRGICQLSEDCSLQKQPGLLHMDLLHWNSEHLKTIFNKYVNNSG